MKRLLMSATILAAFAAPAVQASVISIDDSSPAETLQLYIALPASGTNPVEAAPGTGSRIDITTPTNTNGISDIHHNPATERLGFTFADHSPWPTNVTRYRYLTEAGGGFSDLFVVQGIGGTNPDYITFISNDALTGDFATDAATFGLQLNPAATPALNLGTLAETGDWQLMDNTGPDQYYVRSDLVEIPEPASLALVVLALAGAAGVTRRRT